MTLAFQVFLHHYQVAEQLQAAPVLMWTLVLMFFSHKSIHFVGVCHLMTFPYEHRSANPSPLFHFL